MAARAAGHVAGAALSSLSRGQPPAPPPPPRGSEGGVTGIILFAFTLPWAIAVLAGAFHGHVSGKAMGTFIIVFLLFFFIVAPLVYGLGKEIRGRRVTRKYLAVPKPDTTAVNWRALADVIDARTREGRVEALLSIPCPAPPEGCGAAAGTSCTRFRLPAIVLSGPRPLVLCHLARANEAMALGYADPEDVIAQFGGEIPEGLEIPEVTATWQ